MTGYPSPKANPNFNLYDEDFPVLERVTKWMEGRQGTSMNLEDFRRTSIERFHDAGFIVDVKVFTTDEEGVYAFDVEILDRVVREEEYDFDKQVHQVVNNLLELPDQDGGVIDTDKSLKDLLAREKEMGGHAH
jgi:hypothetical protein